MSNWSKYSRRTQFRIALDVARRRGVELTAAFPNVVGVGAGFRSKGGDESVYDEVCLRFLVQRKWKSRIAKAKAIPPSIRARVRVGKKLVWVSIPTDVSEFRGGKPHVALDLTGGITSRHLGQPLEFGSCCCLVKNRNSPGERFVLSCYHVFSRSLDDTPAGRDCIVWDTGTPIGPMLEAADPEATSNALDATIARITSATIDSVTTWSRAPISRATDFDIASLPKNAQLFVYGRRVAPPVNNLPALTRSTPVPAIFQSVFPHPLKFDYRAAAGKFLFFADTLQYVADVRPGDSGAAVMDTQGKLFGMHFYGQNNNIGYAFSAPRLFESGVFSFDITLT